MAGSRLKSMMGYADGTADTSAAPAGLSPADAARMSMLATMTGRNPNVGPVMPLPDFTRGPDPTMVAARLRQMYGAPASPPVVSAASPIGGGGGLPAPAAVPVAPGVSPYAGWQPSAASAAPAAAPGMHWAAPGEVPPSNASARGAGPGRPPDINQLSFNLQTRLAQINAAYPAQSRAAMDIYNQAVLSHDQASMASLAKYGGNAADPRYQEERKQIDYTHAQALHQLMAGQQFQMMQMMQAMNQQQMDPYAAYGLMAPQPY